MILSNQKHCLHSTGSLNTGVSDFHLLVHTILKCTYTRLKPKKIVHRKFSQIDFETDLKVELDNFDIYSNDYDIFETIFERVLDKHAPEKNKLIRGNEKSHMTGELKKAIMKRSNLWNKFQKS